MMGNDKKRGISKNISIFFVITIVTMGFVYIVADNVLCEQTGNIEQPKRSIVPPFDGSLKYPFTKNESVKCGRWRSGSQDYPYFSAPRDGNTRKHAGVDLYPMKGADTPVKAIFDGKVIKVAPFYTRRNGEVTYAVLVDHDEFVVNYAELRKPSLSPGMIVKQKQVIGVVSGTKQLHFELYKHGTMNWLSWYGRKMPPNLIDPTDMMIRVFGIKSGDNSTGKPAE